MVARREGGKARDKGQDMACGGQGRVTGTEKTGWREVGVSVGYVAGWDALYGWTRSGSCGSLVPSHTAQAHTPSRCSRAWPKDDAAPEGYEG